MELSAQSGKSNRSLEFGFEFHENGSVHELINTFGEEVVKKNALAKMVIGIQDMVRRELDKGTSDADILSKVAAYKPGVPAIRARSDKAAKALELFEKMSEEDKARFAAMFKAALA